MHLFLNEFQPTPSWTLNYMVDDMTIPFASLPEFVSVLSNASKPDSSALALAQERNAQLTKPAGALGRLEDLALWYAA